MNQDMKEQAERWLAEPESNRGFAELQKAESTVQQAQMMVEWVENSSKVYYLKDHLGSVRVAVDETGAVVGYDDYDPWGLTLAGRSMATQGNLVNKFTGKERDTDLGLDWDYFGARYYMPKIGRWSSVDPLTRVDLSVSPYHYTHNNPVNRFDLDGKADFGSPEKLRAAGLKVLKKPSLQPLKDSEGRILQTYCNFGCRDILQEANDHTLDGKTANQIYDYLSDNSVAKEISYGMSVKVAKQGVTVFLVSREQQSSGHVAIVAPEDMQYSGSWQKDVPVVYNVGRVNGVMLASRAFNKSNQPKAFVLRKDVKSMLSRLRTRRIFKNVMERINSYSAASDNTSIHSNY